MHVSLIGASNNTISEAAEQFVGAMSLHGLIYSKELIADGQIHTFGLSSWYAFYKDQMISGAFGDLKQNINIPWCSIPHSDMTQEEILLFKNRNQEIQNKLIDHLIANTVVETTVDESYLADYLADDWQEPEPIQQELPPVENFPIDALPEPLRDFIIDESYRMQCPMDFVGISILAVISSVIGAGCGVMPKKEDDWLVIPNLWGLIIGSPGKLKTPAVSSSISFLEKLEFLEKENFEEKIKQYEIDNSVYEAIKKGLLEKIKKKATNDKSTISVNGQFDIDQLKDDYKQLEHPKKPIRKRYKTNDTTIEKLAITLSENPRGILHFRDVLMGLLMTWEKSGHESDRAFFLEAWNGNATYTADRVSRDTTDTKNLCVSIFGTTQPDKIAAYLYRSINGQNDGLLQRFQLMVCPDDVRWELVDKKPNQEARDKVFETVKSIAEMSFENHGASINPKDKKPFFRLSNEGQLIFYEWLTDLETKKLAEDEHHILTEHLAKYRKLMPSLALIFHVIDLANGLTGNSISVENVENACAFCEYLESHAKRIYEPASNLNMAAATELAKKISTGKLKNPFSCRDVYRQKSGLLKDSKVAKAACDELVEANWLKAIVSDTAQGKKQTTTYEINPKVKRGK